MKVPRLVVPRNLKGPLFSPPCGARIQVWGAASATPGSFVGASLGEHLVCDFPVLGWPLWLLHSVCWSGPNTLQFAFSLGQAQSTGHHHPQHFRSKRISLLLFSPGRQIAADTSFEGSDPGLAAEGQRVPALTVCSEAGMEDPHEAGLTSFNT